jgi:drug/metabolite transporter (DMT)-like permease
LRKTVAEPRSAVPHTTSRHGLMHVLMFLATAFWSANIIAAKEAVPFLGAMTLAQLRLTGAAVLFALVILSPAVRARLRLTRRQWWVLALAAFNGLTLNQILFIGGLSRTSVAHTGLIVALGPVMVLVISCSLRLEPWTPLKVAGMAVSFTGVGILTVADTGGTTGAHWQGDVILVLGSLSFAIFTIQVKEISGQIDALTLNAVAFMMGAILMVPFSAHGLVQVRWQAVPARAWWSVLFMIVLGSVVAYLFYAIALGTLSASRVAAFCYLQPVIAAALGVMLLSEHISRQVIAGGVLILLGVYMTEVEQGREQAPLPEEE